MAGDHSFSELFFTDARVPVSSMLGELNEGWTVATSTLSNERAGVASLYLSLRRKLDRLLEVAGGARRRRRATDRLPRGPRRARWRATSTPATSSSSPSDRSAPRSAAGRPEPEGSVIKLAWAQSEQAVALTALDVLGIGALDGPWGSGMLGSRSLSIAGGTTEVNKNIVAERVLGLPREPKPAARE